MKSICNKFGIVTVHTCSVKCTTSLLSEGSKSHNDTFAKSVF